MGRKVGATNKPKVYSVQMVDVNNNPVGRPKTFEVPKTEELMMCIFEGFKLNTVYKERNGKLLKGNRKAKFEDLVASRFDWFKETGNPSRFYITFTVSDFDSDDNGTYDLESDVYFIADIISASAKNKLNFVNTKVG